MYNLYIITNSIYPENVDVIYSTSGKGMGDGKGIGAGFNFSIYVGGGNGECRYYPPEFNTLLCYVENGSGGGLGSGSIMHEPRHNKHNISVVAIIKEFKMVEIHS